MILSTKGSIKMQFHKCYYCNGPLIWGGDDDEDFSLYDKEFELVTNLTCSECDAFVLYHKPKEREE